MKELPDLTEYLKKLEILSGLDLTNASSKEIERQFFAHAQYLPQSYGHMDAEEFNKFKFYRVRLNILPEKENVYLHSTYSYPPASFCTQNGRANIKRRSVFYCSESADMSIMESKVKPGESGVLSIWTPRVDREVRYSVFMSNKTNPENKFFKLANELREFQKTQTPQFSKEKFEHLNRLNDFVSGLLESASPPYALSSWLCDRFMYNTMPVDCILYSSGYDSRFANLAIHPNFADQHLKLERVVQFIIYENSTFGLYYQLGLTGIPGWGNIEWRKLERDELAELAKNLNGCLNFPDEIFKG